MIGTNKILILIIGLIILVSFNIEIRAEQIPDRISQGSCANNPFIRSDFYSNFENFTFWKPKIPEIRITEKSKLSTEFMLQAKFRSKGTANIVFLTTTVKPESGIQNPARIKIISGKITNPQNKLGKYSVTDHQNKLKSKGVRTITASPPIDPKVKPFVSNFDSKVTEKTPLTLRRMKKMVTASPKLSQHWQTEFIPIEQKMNTVSRKTNKFIKS